MNGSDSVAGRFFDGWETYNQRIVEVIRTLSAEELAVRPVPDRWPVWATVGHTASMRVYWLCSMFQEPGADSTPFTDPSGIGWEDDLETPRTAAELVEALDTTWKIVAGCLERWTLDQLFEEFEPLRGTRTQVHTRQAVLVRLFSHDAYHCGELSQTLGIHGLPQIDLWRADEEEVLAFRGAR